MQSRVPPECDACGAAASVGTCAKCRAGSYCSEACFARDHTACVAAAAPLASTTPLGFYLGYGKKLSVRGTVERKVPDADFDALRKRAADPDSPVYKFGEYSRTEDELLYKCFGASREYPLRIILWVPNYAFLANDAKWRDQFQDRVLDCEDQFIMWLAREERRAFCATGQALVTALDAADAELAADGIEPTDRDAIEGQRRDLVAAVIKLNPLAVRRDAVVVALTSTQYLVAAVAASVPVAQRQSLLYHRGYRQALLDIIYRSRVHEDASPSRFYAYLDQSHMRETGIVTSWTRNYRSTRRAVRSWPDRFLWLLRDFARDEMERDAPRIFTLRLSNRDVADALLEYAWGVLGKLVDYMERHHQALRREFRRHMKTENIAHFVDAYRTGRVLIYEWFTLGEVMAAVTSWKVRTGWEAGIGISLRDIDRPQWMHTPESVRATLLHELAHVFDDATKGHQTSFPSDWDIKRHPDTNVHTPTFVAAQTSLIQIADRSGVPFPKGVPLTAGAFERHMYPIDKIFEPPKKMRTLLGIPYDWSADDNRPYDRVFSRYSDDNDASDWEKEDADADADAIGEA